jgi:predicted porin
MAQASETDKTEGDMTPKNRTLFLAVAGALGLPEAAVAQSSSVQIYGRLYPQFQGSKTSGATAPGTPQAALSTLTGPSAATGDLRYRNEVNSSNSRLGFRGTEDLGNGLRAVWQIEQRVRIDTGNDVWANRDSFLGLAGNFGTVRLGNMDSVYKNVGDVMSFLGVSSGNIVSNSTILSRIGFASRAVQGGEADFHARIPNSVVYETPSFGGFRFQAQYSPDERRTGDINARLQSYGAVYEAGPLYLALAHEIHDDFFGGSNAVASNGLAGLSNTGVAGAHSKDRATRGTVMYTFGNTRVTADLARKEYKETGGAAGRFESYRHRTYQLGAEHRFGNVTGAISYADANAGTCSLFGGVACSTSGLEGRQLNLGAAYNFSRRTSLFGLYSLLRNGSSARYTTNQNDVGAGADLKQWAVGVSHTF